PRLARSHPSLDQLTDARPADERVLYALLEVDRARSEGIIEHERAGALHEIRLSRIPRKRSGVVHDIVAAQESQQDEIGMVAQDTITEQKELLGRAEAAHAEVEHLDARRRRRRAPFDLLADDRTEAGFEGNLERLGVRVAQDRDAIDARGLLEGALEVFEARAVVSGERRSFAAPPAGSIRIAGPPGDGIHPAEGGISHSRE